MGAFQDLPPITNIGSFPLPTPVSTQNIVFRPPLLSHATFTLQDESHNRESNPEREPETQRPPQTRNPTQSQSQSHSHSHSQSQSQSQSPPLIQTSENGSNSTSDDLRTTIIPCGDGFYPNKDTIKEIGNAIMARFGEGEPNWKKLKDEQIKLWLEDFKKKYKWAKSHDKAICENFHKSGSSKYRTIMQQVRKSKSQPLWMGDAAYAKLSEYWRSSDFAEKSDLGKRNRNEDAGACMHTTGSKPHSVVWLEMNEKNGGVDPPMDEYFSCTHKYQKGPKVGNWVSQQSQAKFESFSKLKEEIASSGVYQSEGSSQDEATQSKMPSDLSIYTQSVGGKKKGRIAGIGSLGKAIDSTLSFQSMQFSCPLSDNPVIASMKSEMEALRLENEQLKQQQEISNKTNEQMKQQQEVMSTQLQQIFQQLPFLNNNIRDSSAQLSQGDQHTTGS